MRRRDVNRALIGAGLALPTMAPALWANQGEKDRDTIELSRVELRLVAGLLLLNWMVIASSGGILGYDLRQPKPRFDENRVGLSAIPLLGTLTRPLVTQRLADAHLIGLLFIVGTMLILRPQQSRFQPRSRALIVNRDQSWELSDRPRPISVSNLPLLGDIDRLAPVGKAFANDRELIVLVRPTIVGIPGD